MRVVPSWPFARAASTSLAHRDDEFLFRVSHAAALLSYYGDAAFPLPRPGVSRLSSSTSHPIVCPRPDRQVGSRCHLGCGSIPICFFFLLLSVTCMHMQRRQRQSASALPFSQHIHHRISHFGLLSVWMIKLGALYSRLSILCSGLST
jgi:hypothetical protein